MHTFKTINTKAKQAGFSTIQIALGHLIIILFISSLLLLFGKTVFTASEVQAKGTEITSQQAEQSALGMMGYGYAVEKSFETMKDGKKAFVVELSYVNGTVTHGYPEYVLVIETKNGDKPIRSYAISKNEMKLLK